MMRKDRETEKRRQQIETETERYKYVYSYWNKVLRLVRVAYWHRTYIATRDKEQYLSAGEEHGSLDSSLVR